MPEQPKFLKKTEKPLVVWFRLYGADKAAMQAVSGKRRGAHNAVAMAGTMAEIARLRAAAAPVSAKEAKTIEAFKKVTGSTDITPVLAAAMRDYVEREAKGPFVGRPAPVIDTTGITIRKSA